MFASVGLSESILKNADTTCLFLVSNLGQNKFEETVSFFIVSLVIRGGKRQKIIVAVRRLLAQLQGERRQRELRQQEPQCQRELCWWGLRPREVSALRQPCTRTVWG